MNNRIAVFPLFVVAVLLFSGTIVKAEELSIERAVELAIQNHPTLNSLQSTITMNEHLLKQEKSSRHPTLDYGLSMTSYLDEQIPFTDNGKVTNRLSASYVLYDATREPGIAARNNTLEASRLDLSRFRRQLRHMALSTFMEVYMAGQALEVEKESQAYFKELKKDAFAQFEEGLIAETDYLTFADAYNQSRVQVESLEYSRKAALLALEKLVLVEINDETILVLPEVPYEYDVADRSSLVEKAHKRRYDIVSMRMKIKSIEASRAAARGTKKPAVVVGTDYSLIDNAVSDLDHNDDVATVYAQLQWRLFDSKARDHRIGSLTSRLDSARQELTKLEWDVRSEVLDAGFRIDSANNSIRIMKQSVADAEKNLSIQTERYRAGLVRATEVTDAEVNLTRAKLVLIKAKVELGVAVSALELAVRGIDQ